MRNKSDVLGSHTAFCYMLFEIAVICPHRRLFILKRYINLAGWQVLY